eukprot:CAMPEP_0174760522 /NCGR_PEP_ID=MMETSP1094-20130205/108814_1 /TAXON_ID=156173 /ORGANISM="Chrysochromulina brevifilum, Strain UTEX LB 985" /LENGTH=143 /DNA_ID=CAMNT_0015966463 /DNA_START=733 /DNA_END=1164 /DNA_ORIENTATION=+
MSSLFAVVAAVALDFASAVAAAVLLDSPAATGVSSTVGAFISSEDAALYIACITSTSTASAVSALADLEPRRLAMAVMVAQTKEISATPRAIGGRTIVMDARATARDPGLLRESWMIALDDRTSESAIIRGACDLLWCLGVGV